MENWEDPLTPVIWLGAGSILFLTIIGFIVIFLRTHIRRIREEERKKHELKLSYQKSLLSTSIEIQEKERSRIAGNLHDDLIGQLHMIKLMNNDAKLNTLLAKSIQTSRAISHELSPPLLEQLPIIELLEGYLEPLKSRFRVDHGGDVQGLATAQKLQTFRIAQEVLTNITKHALAKSINIRWRTGRSKCCLRISDDGQGFAPQKGQGLGMKNIELRAQLLDGQYRFYSRPGAGTTFLLTFPMYHENT